MVARRPADFLLLSALVLGLSAGGAERASLSWRAPADFVRQVRAEGGRVSSPAGAPALPETVVHLDVPAGMAYEGLSHGASWRAADEEPLPEPVPHPWRPGTPPSPVEADAAVWGRDVWPEAPVALLGEYVQSGRRRVAVRVRPCRWRGAHWPATGRGHVEVASALAFTVTFTNVPAAVRRPALRSAVPSADLVILSPPDLRDAWEFYADARRRQRPGLAISVVGTDAVYARHPFGADAACANAAESIHAFIRGQAAAGTGMFLLGGMWLDARAAEGALRFRSGERLSLSNCVPGICARPYTGSGCGEIPSDMFYACLDDVDGGLAHPWDPNGDGVYLDEAEAALCDRVPDVVVGRFAAVPADYGGGALPTPAQLVTNYAAKVVRGEDPAFPGAAAFGLASATHTTTFPGGSPLLGRERPDLSFLDDVENMWSPRHAASISDSEFIVRELFRTCVAPFRPVASVESLHASVRMHARRYPDFAVARTAWFARDMLYALCRSHGSSTTAASDGTSWLTRDLYARATGLALFSDFGFPCETGSLECTRMVDGLACVDASLGVAAVCAPGGGTVTGVFNTGYGWGMAFESTSLSDSYSGTISYNLARRLFEQGDGTFAEAHLHARQEYATRYEMKGVRLYALCEQVFHGDPSVRLPAVGKRTRLEASARPEGAVLSADLVADGDSATVPGGSLRVMRDLAFPGTNLVLNLSGGVGRLDFTGPAPGGLALSGEGGMFVGGISNCASVAVRGGAAVLDLRGSPGLLGRLTVEGGPDAPCTNVLRAVASDALADLEPVGVRNATLCLEAADALGAGAVPLALVTNGTLRLSPSPLWRSAEDGAFLARPVYLADATLHADPEGVWHFGRRRNGVLAPFPLHVSGRSAVSSSGGVVALVGTTRVDVAAGGWLDWSLAVTNRDAGCVAFSGPGTTRVAGGADLSGCVEVCADATLDLAALPLANVTSLVVRSGAALRIPGSESGCHQVVAPGGSLVVESGGRVLDAAGRELEGLVANGTFFEGRAMLRWKGGTGCWSDADGWIDPGTGRRGGWIDGRSAAFDQPAVVSNDLSAVQVVGFVLAADTELQGGPVQCGTPDFVLPPGVRVRMAAPLGCPAGLRKLGGGTLVLAGAQPDVRGALAVQEGRLVLDGVQAAAVTNLSTREGAELALRGSSALVNAQARASFAPESLACVEEGARLELGTFAPSSRLRIPAGLHLVVSPPDLSGIRWTGTLDGTVTCRDVLSLAYGVLEGTGTLRVPGLMSRCYTSMAKIRGCGIELAPGPDGRFPVWGKGIYASHYGYFSFDGVTFRPVGGDVVLTGLGYAMSRAVMYVEEGGVTFDAADSLVFGEAGGDLLFGGPGDVTKTGPGVLRFASVYDQHEGRTHVRGGTYAVDTWTLSSAFLVTGPGAAVALSAPECRSAVELGPGTCLDLSAPVPTLLATTNLVCAAGAEIRLALSPDGGDVLDVRGGSLVLPASGTLRMAVSALPGTPAGTYPLLLADALPQALRESLDVAVEVPPGARARVVFSETPGWVAVSYRAPSTATAILVR